MPLPVKIVQYAIAVGLALLIAFPSWEIVTGKAPMQNSIIAGFFLVTLIGLIRRVAWGRFLVSGISVVLAFMIAAILIPDIDDSRSGGTSLERIFGFMPPHWVSWLIVVLAVSLVLLPAVVIGWRKEWFRRSLW